MRSPGITVCLLALALAACGGPTIVVPASGSLAGHVSLRACGGANREYPAGCPTQALSGVKLTFQQKGVATVSTATTDSSGAYQIQLAPGTYAVTLETTANYSSLSGPRQVSVRAGQTLAANYTYTIQLM
jgi:hypothetical protein